LDIIARAEAIHPPIAGEILVQTNAVFAPDEWRMGSLPPLEPIESAGIQEDKRRSPV
jgi:hypothetical protein